MIPMKTIPGYNNNRAGIQVGTKLPGEIKRDKSGKYIFMGETETGERERGSDTLNTTCDKVYCRLPMSKALQTVLVPGRHTVRQAGWGVETELPHRDE